MLLSETFASGIPGGFATVLTDSGGTFTAVADGGSLSVDLDRRGYNGVWRIDASPTAAQLRVVMDVEILIANNATATAPSLGLAVQDTAGNIYHALVVYNDGVVGAHRGITAGAVGNQAGEPRYSSAYLPSSGRFTAEFSLVNQPSGTGMQYQATIDGEMWFWPIPVVQPVQGLALRPGIFLRDKKIRLHSIEVHDNPTYLSLPYGPELHPEIPQVAQYAPTWPVVGVLTPWRNSLGMYDWGGLGRVAGDVMIKGLPDSPVSRIVRLVRELDGVCIAEQWSALPLGTYEFLGVDPLQRYTVLAYDFPGGYRAAIASGVLPEPMTV